MVQTAKIDQIRRACNLLLDQIERQFGPELILEGHAVPADYWTVELREAFTFAPSPTLAAGEFREDAAEVVDVLSREPESISLWHDLDHLAALLRGIAFMDLPGR